MVYNDQTKESVERIVQPPQAVVYVSAFKQQEDIFADGHPCKSSDFGCYLVSGGVKRPKRIPPSAVLNQVVMLLLRDEETEKILAKYAREAEIENAAQRHDHDADDDEPADIARPSIDPDCNEDSSDDDDDSSSEETRDDDDDDEAQFLKNLLRSRPRCTKRKQAKLAMMRKVTHAKKFRELPPIVFSRMALKKSVKWIAQSLLHVTS
jgi:hypothetical protein